MALWHTFKAKKVPLQTVPLFKLLFHYRIHIACHLESWASEQLWWEKYVLNPVDFYLPGFILNTIGSSRKWTLSCFSELGGVDANPATSYLSSVAQSCPTLCDPMNHSTPALPVHQLLPEFTQTHVHWVGYAIQPSHPLSSPSPPAPNPSQHQSLFQWVNSSHEVAKVLEFQL